MLQCQCDSCRTLRTFVIIRNECSSHASCKVVRAIDVFLGHPKNKVHMRTMYACAEFNVESNQPVQLSAGETASLNSSSLHFQTVISQSILVSIRKLGDLTTGILWVLCTFSWWNWREELVAQGGALKRWRCTISGRVWIYNADL